MRDVRAREEPRQLAELRPLALRAVLVRGAARRHRGQVVQRADVPDGGLQQEADRGDRGAARLHPSRPPGRLCRGRDARGHGRGRQHGQVRQVRRPRQLRRRGQGGRAGGDHGEGRQRQGADAGRLRSLQQIPPALPQVRHRVLRRLQGHALPQGPHVRLVCRLRLGAALPLLRGGHHRRGRGAAPAERRAARLLHRGGVP
mmetsp:Transcript_1502/g.4734  ORF Transcript_1502/g.4734 Transcript_1502/m.4734 type:complete len:201 (+) Transcript_1502:714-1316(+)